MANAFRGAVRTFWLLHRIGMFGNVSDVSSESEEETASTQKSGGMNNIKLINRLKKIKYVPPSGICDLRRFRLSWLSSLVLFLPNTFKLFCFSVLNVHDEGYFLFQKRVVRTKFDIYVFDFVSFISSYQLLQEVS